MLSDAAAYLLSLTAPPKRCAIHVQWLAVCWFRIIRQRDKLQLPQLRSTMDQEPSS
jgi:hypothetical protein